MPRISSKEMDFPATINEARKVQERLVSQVNIADDFSTLKTVAGVDVSYDMQRNMTRAFIVVMKLETLIPYISVTAELPTHFPYVPGFLSFREIPAILEALKLLPDMPDLLMVDGQGVAHPRRLGIAAHLGVLTGLPAIGVAKSRLLGVFEQPGPHKGDQTLLWDKSERIDAVLRSKEKTLPLFISPGHRVSHETAMNLTLRCLTRYRLPEPTRIADKQSKMKPSLSELLL